MQVGRLIHNRDGWTLRTTPALAFVGKSQSVSKNVVPTFRSQSSLSDRGASPFLHVHVPDPFLGPQQEW